MKPFPIKQKQIKVHHQSPFEKLSVMKYRDGKTNMDQTITTQEMQI